MFCPNLNQILRLLGTETIKVRQTAFATASPDCDALLRNADSTNETPELFAMGVKAEAENKQPRFFM